MGRLEGVLRRLAASRGLLEVSWRFFRVDGILWPIFIGFNVKISINRTREKGLWYYKNSSSEPSGYFRRKVIQDAIFVPTCPHMASQNAPKTCLGGVLEPLGLVLGPLWPSWRHLEASWRHLGASWAYLGASWPILEASWRRLGAPKSMARVQNPSDALVPGRGGGGAAATPGLSGRIRIIRKGYQKEGR